MRGDRLPRLGADRLGRVAASFVAGCILEAARRHLPDDLPLVRWIRSFCPFCGGQPDMAVMEDEGRQLVCVRCNGGWHTGAGGGMWFAALGHAVSVTYARGEHDRFYLKTGLPF